MPDFYEVSVAIPEAKAIAWDTCHKIYVLMDDAQVEKMREYGYGDENDPDSLITKAQMNNQQMLDTVKKWYEDSCSLRFVQAVETVADDVDANEGFTSLIEQGADWPKQVCPDCGDDWEDCTGDCRDDDEPEEDDEDDL
jgi:hypothetical protein